MKGKGRSRLEKILRRDGGRCQICGCEVAIDRDGIAKATVDHIIPKSRGGTNFGFNLQLACRDCNSRKSNKIPYDAFHRKLMARNARAKRRQVEKAERRKRERRERAELREKREQEKVERRLVWLRNGFPFVNG